MATVKKKKSVSKSVPAIDDKTKQVLVTYQRNEITEYSIYSRLAKVQKNKENSEVLYRIAEDEKKHYAFWKSFTNREVAPDRFRIMYYYWISRILGLNFGIKLMERGEEQAQENYEDLTARIPGSAKVKKDEEQHEKELVALIQEERLNYVGSIVLGLNDALVELTGALAGLTFAFQNTGLVALAGLITGISASFSMAASEFLSARSSGDGENALKSSLYTGIAYIFTVVFLVVPYFVFNNPYLALVFTILTALLIILIFNFYVSVAKDYSFKKRFLEMASLSLAVAAISFGIGFMVRRILGVEI